MLIKFNSCNQNGLEVQKYCVQNDHKNIAYNFGKNALTNYPILYETYHIPVHGYELSIVKSIISYNSSALPSDTVPH